MHRVSERGPLSSNVGRIRCKRQLQDDFVLINSPGVTKAEQEVEGLRTTGARNIRELQLVEQALAAHMLDDLKQRSSPNATALELGIDHEAPNANLWLRRWGRKKGLIFQHDKAREFFAAVDGTIPGLWREKRLSQRNRVWCDKPLLAIGYRQPGHSAYRFGRDLAKRDG